MEAMSSNQVPFLVVTLIFVVSEFRNYFERKALVNRLLAKDLTDLAAYETEPKRVKIPDKIRQDGFEV